MKRIIRVWWSSGLLAAMGTMAAEPAAPLTVSLAYQETPFAISQVGTINGPGTVRFTRQPDFGGRKVVRGSFYFHDDTNVVGFAWDHTQSKLHVDINRNGDLTDDPEGVFNASFKDEKRQVFPQIRLKVRTPSGMHPCMVEASLAHPNGYGSLLLHSFWQASLTIAGTTNQVGLLEPIGAPRGSNQRNYLILRSWKDREEPFSVVDGTPDAFFFSSRLYYQSKAFAVEGRFAEENNKEVFQLALKEETPKLGDLKVTGSHLHRLILEDNNGYTAVLDKPTEQTRLPLGTYSLSETWVRSGTLQAVSTAGRRIEIKADSALALLAGGPLTNSVILERKRETLNMSYQLIGIDGEKYRLQPEDRDHPPTYTVWLSGRQVATGKFAYG